MIHYHTNTGGLEMFRTILTLCVAVAVTTCSGKPINGTPPTDPNANAETPRIRAKLDATYRVAIDKRFLVALDEMQKLFAGDATPQVTAEFSVDHWIVKCGSAELGAAPEFPDFSDFMRLADAWVKVLEAEHGPLLHEDAASPTLPDIEKRLDAFWLPNPGEAGRLTDEQWQQGVHTPTILAAAAKALVYLSLQQIDTLESADRVPAKALALLALTRSLTALPCVEEEALLAGLMGYTQHARTAIRSLPDDNAVRLYVLRDDAALARVAEQPVAEPLAQYLYLLRLSRNAFGSGNPAPFVSWVHDYLPDQTSNLSVLKAAVDMDMFSISRHVPLYLPYVSLLSVAVETSATSDIAAISKQLQDGTYSEKSLQESLATIVRVLNIKPAALVGHFEDAMAVLDSKYPGPLVDPATVKGFYVGAFYSGFYLYGIHCLDDWSSADAATAFAETLGNPTAGMAADFVHWYGNLAQSKSGRGDPEALLKDLAGISTFGAPVLTRTLEEQKRHFSWGDPELGAALRQLLVRLDTRPSHLAILTDEAFESLEDLRLTEKYARARMALAGDDAAALRVWFACFVGDAAPLRECLEDNSVPAWIKANALQNLNALRAMDESALISAYDRLVAQEPDTWPLRRRYATFLENKQRYQDARAVIESWLQRKPAVGGLEYVHAHTKRAQLFIKEGDYEQALEAVRPAVSSWQSTALYTAAEALDGLGRDEEAEEIAREALDRYPDYIAGRALLAKLLWKKGRIKEAALMLAQKDFPVAALDWRHKIGESFVDVYGDLSVSRAVEAFDALLAAGIEPFTAQELANAARNRGRNELAFELFSRLKYPNFGQMEFTIRAYNALLSLKGKDVALEWFRETVPAEWLNASAMFAFRAEQYDLLWDYIQEPANDEHEDFVWLMRAAASACLGAENDPHRAELMSVLKKRKSTRYYRIARYFVGLTSETDVLKEATDPRSTCEVAYYVGLRAQCEGRFYDASDWYRVSAETGLTRCGEYRWAKDTLYLWRSERISLDRLAEAAKGRAADEETEPTEVEEDVVQDSYLSRHSCQPTEVEAFPFGGPVNG
jgi:tetratricopeptide (TPR) repeat protein